MATRTSLFFIGLGALFPFRSHRYLATILRRKCQAQFFAEEFICRSFNAKRIALIENDSDSFTSTLQKVPPCYLLREQNNVQKIYVQTGLAAHLFSTDSCHRSAVFL